MTKNKLTPKQLFERIDKSLYLPLVGLIPYIYSSINILIFTRLDSDLAVSIISKVGFLSIWQSGIIPSLSLILAFAAGTLISYLVRKPIKEYGSGVLTLLALLALFLPLFLFFMFGVMKALLYITLRFSANNKYGQAPKFIQKSEPKTPSLFDKVSYSALILIFVFSLFSFPSNSQEKFTYKDGSTIVGQEIYTENDDILLLAEHDSGKNLVRTPLNYIDREYCTSSNVFFTLKVSDIFSQDLAMILNGEASTNISGAECGT